MTLRPVEWEVRLPLSGEAVAIVRAVQLGAHGDVYLRAVTPDADRSQRDLIGYWASPQEAHDGVLALYERRAAQRSNAVNRALPTATRTAAAA